MAYRIQLRRGSSGDWASNNPILAQGEPGVEIDTNKFKIGDGINNWNSLSYFNDADSIFTTWAQANSANYDSTFTTVNTNSADWYQTLLFNDATAELTISNGNTVSLSALSGGGGVISEADPIFTTWAQANSANYDYAYGTIINGGTIGGDLTVVGTISATNILATSATITKIDISQYELSGFVSTGDLVVEGNISAQGYLSADSMYFNTGAGLTDPAQGQIIWDADDQALQYGMNGVTSKISQDMFMRVKATETIVKGQAVRASGASGDGSGNITGALYSANSASSVDEIYFVGLAAEDLSTNDFGFVQTQGKIHGVDVASVRATDDPEYALAANLGWPIGTILYVSPFDTGKLTQTKPTAPNIDIAIAIVISTNGNQRSLYTRYEHGYHLDEIHDVRYIQPLVDGDLLTWDNTLSAWINKAETDPIFSTWAQANSANYESTYTTVNTNSASWSAGGTDSQTLSFDESNARLSISNGNIVSLSALSGDSGGGGLTNFTETLHTSSPNNTVNAAQLEVTGGTTDADLVLTPKGAGAFIVGPEPDGVATGGNKPGAGAFSAVSSRSSSDQVASGANSVAIGYRAKASGSGAVALGLATASGTRSFATGSNTFATADYAFAIHDQNTASAKNAFAAGELSTASGYLSLAHSYGATASVYFATCYAFRGAVTRRGQFSTGAGGNFFGNQAITGGLQSAHVILSSKTTDATPTMMVSDNFFASTSQGFSIPSGNVITALVLIVGHKSDGSAVAVYNRQFAAKNVAGTTSLVGSVITIGTDTAAGTSIAITANDTNDAIDIEVTGITAETWRWAAYFVALETKYGT